MNHSETLARLTTSILSLQSSARDFRQQAADAGNQFPHGSEYVAEYRADCLAAAQRTEERLMKLIIQRDAMQRKVAA